jgi:hypothetical protein
MYPIESLIDIRTIDMEALYKETKERHPFKEIEFFHFVPISCWFPLNNDAMVRVNMWVEEHDRDARLSVDLKANDDPYMVEIYHDKLDRNKLLWFLQSFGASHRNCVSCNKFKKLYKGVCDTCYDAEFFNEPESST